MSVAVMEAERTRLDAVGRGERFVFDGPLLPLVAVCYLATVLVYGWRADGTVYYLQQIADDPFTQIDVGRATHLYLSPLNFLIAHAIGMPTAGGFGLIQAAMNVIVVFGCAWLVGRYVNRLAGRLFVVAFFASPEAQMSTFTYGRLDVLTVGAGTVFMTAPAWLCAAVGAVAGFHHFEQVAVVLVVAAILRVGLLRQPARPMIFAVGGVLVGKLLVQAYLAASGIDATSERARWISDSLHDTTTLWHGRALIVLWSVFGVIWLPLLWMGRRLERRERELLLLAGLVALGVTATTMDLTRVPANLTWPIVMVAVIWFSQRPDRAWVRRSAVVLLVVAFVVPRLFVHYQGVVVNRW